MQTGSICDKLFFCDGDGLCFYVFYCIVNVVCKKCKVVPFDSDGSGDKCINQFCKYMIEIDKNCKSIWITHNSARFDTLFIMRWMLTRFNITP